MDSSSSSHGLADSPTSSHGLALICGRRRIMEDAIKISPRLMMLSDQPEGSEEVLVVDFFGVYDGHGGGSIANACRDKLDLFLDEEIRECLEQGNEINWNRIFGNSFVKLDEEIDNLDIQVCDYITGSSVLVALVSLNQIIVTHCGDSRAILCRGGEVIPLSTNLVPDRPREVQREEAVHGDGLYWHGQRVFQIFTTSPPFIGDQHFNPSVIPVQVSITERNENDEFIILATRSLWNVITNETACEVVRKILNDPSPSRSDTAANLLAKLAMANESEENISVVVIEIV